ncbi:hypothetical protein [Floridanema aerugineum]|uniref:Urease accessory protein UreH-like transmembrane domain-containing protein n=1 Tax=Floridaenema aerugineum BLCC-F46 TaxID=3153654 RepID=A0ABV4X8D6_9CYAN
MTFGTIFCLNLISSPLILGSLNAFGILWSGILWMIAGFIAGVLAAIPICAIVLSSSNFSEQQAQERVIRTAAFVVGVITLIGLLFGASQEYDKQQQSRYRSDIFILPRYQISKVMPIEFRNKSSS